MAQIVLDLQHQDISNPCIVELSIAPLDQTLTRFCFEVAQRLCILYVVRLSG